MKRFNCMTKLLLSGVAATAIVAGAALLETAVDTPFAGTAEAQSGQGKGQGGQGAGGGRGGGQGQQGAGRGAGGGGQGGKGGVPSAHDEEDSEDHEDSDRPDWAGKGGGGNPDAGTGDPDSDRPSWAGRGADKPGGGKPTTEFGSLYGDMYVVLRDEDGVPILKEIVGEHGTTYVKQPLDADGNLVPLDDEGHPIDESLVQEVELSRLNMARSPDKVAARAHGEAIDTLNAATDVKTDAAGRLVVLIDGEWKTIDSPVENLGLYTDLMDDGKIEGITNPVILNAFPHLTDGQLTPQDLSSAAVLLAATADKFKPLTLDAVMYANDIIGVNDPLNGTYKDLSSVAYTRSSVYGGITADVLIDPDGDGTFTVQTVNIYDAVFGGSDASATNAVGYAQSVDDARAVINYIHEYAVPAESLEGVGH